MLLLLSIVCLVVTPFYIIYKPPKFVISRLQARWPSVLWQVATTEKIVALTIDDGPSEYTTEILDILKANDATATFFIIGSQTQGQEDTLQELLRHGNELGNHAMFDEPSLSLSDNVLAEQLQKVQQTIDRAYAAVNLQQSRNYFRPGSGFFSRRMLDNITQLGYHLILGSIYPHDPQIPFARVNAAHILSMIRPGGVIICHDRRPWTAPMLRRVLPIMKQRGYRIVTVTRLLEEVALR